MSFAAQIVPFPAAPQARRTPANASTSRAIGTSRFEPRYRQQNSPPRPSLKARRLAALAAAAKRVAMKAERRALLDAIRDRAVSEKWGARETARRVSLNRMALARLARGELNLEVWLPRLRAAVHRLAVIPERQQSA